MNFRRRAQQDVVRPSGPALRRAWLTSLFDLFRVTAGARSAEVRSLSSITGRACRRRESGTARGPRSDGSPRAVSATRTSAILLPAMIGSGRTRRGSPLLSHGTTARSVSKRSGTGTLTEVYVGAWRRMATPIYVDFLDPGDTGLPGRIGMTIAPGKKADGRWDRNLNTDLKRLRDEYSCDLLVSLMEDDEYRRLQIEGLFEIAPTHGIAVLRFPINDGHPPHDGEMLQFLELIGQILEAARAGQTVVIHCRGGLGRTGTVAAACLVALGHAPAEAIERVRVARHGAVETREQELWVEAYAYGVRPE